jgi:hypothetical protein
MAASSGMLVSLAHIWVLLDEMIVEITAFAYKQAS